jgi:hypothetical protein
MPLNPTTYLESQGWTQGQGLRNGSRAKPITMAQKRTLSGIGKGPPACLHLRCTL